MLGITSSSKLQAMINTLPNKLVEVCVCNFDPVLEFLKMKCKAGLYLPVCHQSSRIEKFMNSRQSMWSIASPSHDVSKTIENLKESCDSAMEVDEP